MASSIAPGAQIKSAGDVKSVERSDARYWGLSIEFETLVSEILTAVFQPRTEDRKCYYAAPLPF